MPTAASPRRIAVVTGATRGLGYAIAERLLEDGAEVHVTGTRAGGHGPDGSRYHAVDFTDSTATAAFARTLTELRPNVLINNAGINVISPFADIQVEDFDRIQRVNVTAPFLLCRAAVAAMAERGWGRIVNISSIFGTVSKELRGSYSTSKFAIDGMTAALAAEVARHGILANCVSPGVVDTELTRRVLGETGIRDLLARIPIARLAQADEIARFVVWLAGPENTYISGQNLIIDGGFSRV